MVIVTKLLPIIFLIVFLTTVEVLSQNTGTIYGNVVDSETGENVVGANVILESTHYGAASDLDGNYVIENIPSGTYNITVSYLGYSKSRIENVKIKADEKLKIDVPLKSEAIQVDEVVVVGDASLQYEAALLNQQKNAINISDGISREQIAKSPDYTSAEFLQRVPSVTLLEGKYIYVRGVSERYSSAQLNNTTVASSEPDKKDFAFDLIPSYLVENTVVEKSYTPDNPGDFAGGIVKINTVEFPQNTLFRFFYSTGYISNSTSKSFSTYVGSPTDWLGIDNGTRDLPADFPSDFGNLVSSDDSVYNLAKSLSNNWRTIGTKAPINQAFALSYGDMFNFFGENFGLIASANYKSEYQTNNITTNQRAGTDEYVFKYDGTSFNYNVSWGLLLNLSYKIDDFNKIGIKNTFTTNSDDDVIQLFGKQYDRSNQQYLTALRYVQRQLYSGQFSGESYLPSVSGLNVFYAFSYSESNRDEPDFRRYTYARDIDANDTIPYRILTSQLPNLREGGRFYSYLNEYTRSYKLDFDWKFGSVNTKFGSLYDSRSRSFDSRLISVIDQPTTNTKFRYYGIDSVFAPENFRRSGWSIGEYNDGTSDYTTDDECIGFYGMFDAGFALAGLDFSFILGARLENYNLDLNTMNIESTEEIIINNHYNDILPSASLIYRITPAMNLRLSYSNTVNRPQFRELAPFSYYDFEHQYVVTGNPELVEAQISNYDIRYEIFPYIGEIFSASFFYKEFVNPIEKVVVVTTNNNNRSFANASFAKNYGYELELRASLRYISDMLSNFTIVGNYSRIQSEIEETSPTLDRTTRPMQGQSPYIINFSMSYSNSDWGSNFTFLYYKYGKRLFEVATDLSDDYIEQARATFDFVYNQDISEHFAVRFTMKNIFPESVEIYEGDVLVGKASTNTKIALSLGYKL
jgi:hypothetical protein